MSPGASSLKVAFGAQAFPCIASVSCKAVLVVGLQPALRAATSFAGFPQICSIFKFRYREDYSCLSFGCIAANKYPISHLEVSRA